MICTRCGLPLSSESGPRCPECARADGSLAPYEAVLEKLAKTLVRTLGVDEAAASEAAAKTLAALPDWDKNRPGSGDSLAPRLTIDVLADHVGILGVPGLEAPRIERGDRRCILLPTSEGWSLQTAIEQRKGLAALVPDWDRKVEVHVPANLPQIDFLIKAGHLSISQVAARVVGTLGTGHLEISGVTGVDVSVRTGNVNVRGLLKAGEHRISTRVGSVKVELEPESSVELSATVKNGSLEIKGMEGVSGRRVMTRPVHAMVGNGEGSLEVEVRTGHLEVQTPSPARMVP